MISLVSSVLKTGQDLNWSDKGSTTDSSLWLLSFINVIQTTKKELNVRKTNKKFTTFFITSNLRHMLYIMKQTRKVINLLVFNVREQKKSWRIDSYGQVISEYKRVELFTKINFFNIMNSLQETAFFHLWVPNTLCLSFLLQTSTPIMCCKPRTLKV